MTFYRLTAVLLGCLALAACAGPQVVHITPDDKVQVPREKDSEKEKVATDSKRLAEPDADLPAQITSDKMQYREDGRITVFQGHVKVNQGNAWLASPYLEVRSLQGMAYARHGVRLIDHGRGVTATAREMDYNRDMSDVTLRDKVDIATHDDEGIGLKIRCDHMRWNETADAAVATGSVVVHYKDTTATANTMTYHRLQRMMTLSGEGDKTKAFPVVLQGDNTITGETITLHIKDRVYEVEGSAKAVVLPQSSKPSVSEKKP